MIRIPTYKEHRKRKEIFDRYLYMMALILPFSPKDIIGDDVIEVDGEIIDAGNFLEKSGKLPRKRSLNYRRTLKGYGIRKSTSDKEECFAQDQLLAAKIIAKASQELYKYLYYVKNNSRYIKKAPVMNRENLRILLTIKMDELIPVLENIPKIQEKEHQENLLRYVFCYDKFSRDKKVIKLFMDMDVPVCPYCNRQYTFTVSEENGSSRPQFDHYLSKSEYPYFAVSLLNLVPSCGLCNQSKGDKAPKVLYPYSDEMGENVLFRTRTKTGFNYLLGDRNARDEFEVILEPVNNELTDEFLKKLDNSKKYFHLVKLYDGHKDYILHLFRKKYVFNDDYLESLCQQFPDMFSDKNDIKHLMYLMEIDKEHWGRRTLSKLTHDIDLEMRDN